MSPTRRLPSVSTRRRLPARILALACIVALVLGATSCSSSGTSTGTSTTGGAVATGAPHPSSGCTKPQTGPTSDERQDLVVDGTSRWYLITTPAPTIPAPTALGSSPRAGGARSIPRPLVLDFHGLDEGASLHSMTSRFGDLGQKDGFVAVFPEGTGNPIQWDTGGPRGDNPDLAYVTALLNQVESTACIDTSRVYASGFSDGSFMVSLLACTMAQRFAAVATVSGLQLPRPCRPGRRVPIIAFHGTADPILYFNGGIGTGTLNRALGQGGAAASSPTTIPKANLHGSGYPATVRAWAVKDGCDPNATDTRISSQVIRRTYRCPPGAGVEFYIVLGGGHAWPGSAFSRSISSLTGFTTFQINATDEIWAFFERFRL